jgi:hypothetical protein
MTPIGLLTAEGIFLSGTVCYHKKSTSQSGCTTTHKTKIIPMAKLKVKHQMTKDEKGTAYGPYELVFKSKDMEYYSTLPFLLVTDK